MVIRLVCRRFRGFSTRTNLIRGGRYDVHLSVVLLVTALSVSTILLGWSETDTVDRLGLIADSHAAGGTVSEPTGTAPDRYVYYPGTEALEKDEIR